MFTPTPEQQAAVDAFTTGDNMVMEAGAGTGKTSALRLLAESTDRCGLYLAFNRSTADEAEASFPRNTTCRNIHRMSWAAVVRGTFRQQRMSGARQTSRDVAGILGLAGATRINTDTVLAPGQIARLVMETVAKFCHSADYDINLWHAAHQTGVDSPEDRARLAAVLVPLARKAWEDLNHAGGRLKYTGDHHLKAWQLTDPVLDYDFILLDEAQDSDPVTVAIVAAQDAQLVPVGDRSQAIYGWRHAVDAMDSFDARHHMRLTRSFRFGPRIADEANKWLDLLDAGLRLTGTPALGSRVERCEAPDAVLCRTNAQAVVEVMEAIVADRAVAFAGGGKQIRELAECAKSLKQSGWTWHPELAAFRSWGQVQSYVEDDHGGQDLKAFVGLIDTYGPDSIIEAVDACTDERRADVVVSTAHKGKGREWDRVRIADDFPPPREDRLGRTVLDPAEGMLAYVAVTRARRVLDREGLEWVDRLLAERLPAAHTAAYEVTGNGTFPELRGAALARAALRGDYDSWR